jgi:hypothetical protein
MHTLPQPPQLDVSLVVSTHAAPQVVLLPQADAHVPFSQTWVWAQTFPQAPQFFGSEPWSTQLPEQFA